MSNTLTASAPAAPATMHVGGSPHELLGGVTFTTVGGLLAAMAIPGLFTSPHWLTGLMSIGLTCATIGGPAPASSR